MPMQPETLKQFLRAGPSRQFDVRGISRKIALTSESPKYFFATKFLNDCILFKYIDMKAIGGSGRRHRPVSTLIYLPYDVAQPENGGESVVFSDIDFTKLCEEKIKSGTKVNDLIADSKTLKILDSLPTFSPFIVEIAFQRLQIDVPQPYLLLDAELRRTLTGHLKGRLRPLIVAAYQGASENIVERAVDGMTAKLFSMRDVSEIRPLVEALRLPRELTQAVLTSWIGISYFEYEFAKLQPSLRKFERWMTDCQHMVMPPNVGAQGSPTSLANAIRQQVRSDWNSIVGISEAYRKSYDAMVFNGNVEPFVAFLRRAEASYWQMGEVLGKLEQSVVAWSYFTARPSNERQLPAALLLDMLSVLSDLLLEHKPSVPAAAG